MAKMNVSNSDTPVLRRASRNRGLLAFLITSIAAFLLISLWWPLSMQGYRTEGIIEFEDQEIASSLVAEKLPSILRTVMNPAALSHRIDQESTSFNSASKLLDANNLEAIYERLSVGFREGTQFQKPGLRIVLSGSGSSDEAKFIKSFTTDVAARLDYAANAARDPDSMIASKNHSIDQAHWLVNQIEEGLTSARTQSAQLVAHGRPESGAKFRAVGHVRELENSNIDSLHQTLESMDITSLRGVIETFKENQDHNIAGLVRFDANQVTNAPVGAFPGLDSLMMAGLLSLALGGVVAWNIRPFAEHGFESVDDVTTRLGVPVVGTLRGEPSIGTDDTTKTPHSNWANLAVRISGTVLAAIAILGIGFWLTSVEVRNSFSESWFHGFARIVWKLSGY